MIVTNALGLSSVVCLFMSEFPTHFKSHLNHYNLEEAFPNRLFSEAVMLKSFTIQLPQFPFVTYVISM